MKPLELLENTDTVNELLARYGVKFGIYKNNVFKEQLFPFDAIPRIIEKEEFMMVKSWKHCLHLWTPRCFLCIPTH